MSPRCQCLQDIDPTRDDVWGGKACGLARLHAVGARIPEGFAVEAAGDSPLSWPPSERAELCRRAEELLARGPLAVRSSAVGEDAADRSWAGIFTTVLDVADADQVIEAARTCVASATGERASSYVGAGHPIPMGLVVQRQVEAQVAGVCFTIDPTGSDRAVVLEAVAGRGGRLVSGQLQPWRWRAYLSGLGAWEIHHDGQPEGAVPPVLDEVQVEHITSQAKALERALEKPLDLEWCLDGEGTLWWLQVRPITARKPPPLWDVERSAAAADDGAVTLWSNWNVRETMPDPLYPLVWSLWQEVIIPMVARQLFGVSPRDPVYDHLLGLDRIHGRVYFNMNAVLGWPAPLGVIFPRMLHALDARNDALARRLITSGVLRPRRLPPLSFATRLRMWAAALRPLLRLAAALRPRHSLARLAATAEAARRCRPLEELSDNELVAEMRLIARPECSRLADGLQLELVAIAVFVLARHLFRDHPDARRLLGTGLSDNPTTRISLELDRLVQAARPLAELFADRAPAAQTLERLRQSPAGRAWADEFEALVERHGHRGPREFDLGAPRWADDPTMLLELVRAGVVTASREHLAERLERLARERRQAIDRAASASPWWRRPLLRLAARLVELYMPLREAPKHYSMVVFLRMRRAALELGGRLGGAGVLASTEDVFYLEWPELVALAAGDPAPPDLDRRLAARRQRWQAHRALRPPDLVRSDLVPVRDDDSIEAEVLDGAVRGTAISPGVATGPARILAEPDPRAMSDGDVIVMRFADPGWTPLFPRAAAVVMEVGGLMCHAAVVARELGVPAVFGVPGATTILSDGLTVRVDGDAGTVTPVETVSASS